MGLPGTTERPNNRCGQGVTFSGFTHATFCALGGMGRAHTVMSWWTVMLYG